MWKSRSRHIHKFSDFSSFCKEQFFCSNCFPFSLSSHLSSSEMLEKSSFCHVEICVPNPSFSLVHSSIFSTQVFFYSNEQFFSIHRKIVFFLFCETSRIFWKTHRPSYLFRHCSYVLNEFWMLTTIMLSLMFYTNFKYPNMCKNEIWNFFILAQFKLSFCPIIQPHFISLSILGSLIINIILIKFI